MTMSSEMQKQESQELTQRIAELEHSQRFVEGELAGLRAVTESELDALAALMSECPLVLREMQPWTGQKLRKQFNDEKDPGLWAEKRKTYSVVDRTGLLCGFIVQRSRENQIFECSLHIADTRPDRDALGRDLLACYMQLLRDWSDPVRIETYILAAEEQKAGWLRDAGFELEASFEEMYMHRGEAATGQIWGWVNPRVIDG
jgi:hypothetical protein